MNKEEALMSWLNKCPLLGGGGLDAPLLGYLRENDGSCAVRTLAGDGAKEFIDGSRLVSYDFYLELMLSISASTDSVNERNMYLARRWQEWLAHMDDIGDFPDFGEGCVCLEAKNLSSAPQMAQVFEGNMAKYHFPARIVYFEKRIAKASWGG